MLPNWDTVQDMEYCQHSPYTQTEKSLPSNYRPVLLLRILSKVMETIINRTITNFLEQRLLHKTVWISPWP